MAQAEFYATYVSRHQAPKCRSFFAAARHTSGSSRDTEVGVDIDRLVKVMCRVAVAVALPPQGAGAKRTNTKFYMFNYVKFWLVYACTHIVLGKTTISPIVFCSMWICEEVYTFCSHIHIRQLETTVTASRR